MLCVVGGPLLNLGIADFISYKQTSLVNLLGHEEERKTNKRVTETMNVCPKSSHFLVVNVQESSSFPLQHNTFRSKPPGGRGFQSLGSTLRFF